MQIIKFNRNLSQKQKYIQMSFTSLGAMRDAKVMVFSGGGSGLSLFRPINTKQSPDGTALTLALYHVVPPAVDAAIVNS